MASIGLYDIDLWHGVKKYPNLELMKTFNYHYLKGNVVKMIKPKEDIGRFNSVIYFKEHLSTKMPSDLIVSGEKKAIYGRGFYGYLTQLKPEIYAVPPTYNPYDAYADKLSIKSYYDKMKNNSYIRFENKDFTDLKKDSSIIFFADNDLFKLDGIEDFLQENKQKKFYCFNTPHANDEAAAQRYLRYTNLFINSFIIDEYSKSFFLENYKDKVVFNLLIKENESVNSYLIRVINIILWYKKNGIKQYQFLSNKHELIKYLIQWMNTNTDLSFYKFFIDNEVVQKLIQKSITEIRLLLKTNPKSITQLEFK